MSNKTTVTDPLITTTSSTLCALYTCSHADNILTPHACTCSDSSATSACPSFDMDNSISSLLSGGTTRSSSPNSSKRRILSDLESNLSALGHIGLLKYSRDELRRQLNQQKLQTEQQSQAAATLRRVALRLTVNGQEKQERVTELESTVHQFEDQGQRLLDTLTEHDDNSTVPSTTSENTSSNQLHPRS